MERVPFMDWEMVRRNGGPPCFAVGVDGDESRFCARAERWEGHGHRKGHDFVSLSDFAGLITEKTTGLADLCRDAESILNRVGACWHGGADDPTIVEDVDALRRRITRFRTPAETTEVVFFEEKP